MCVEKKYGRQNFERKLGNWARFWSPVRFHSGLDEAFSQPEKAKESLILLTLIFIVELATRAFSEALLMGVLN